MKNTLSQLEQELNITYPEMYTKLYADGMLDWGETGIDWYDTTFPKLKANPPLILFAEDIEIWDPIEYQAGIAEILHHEVYDISEKFKLVPFAKSGGGDLYVFQYDLQNGDDVPVSYLPHDHCELQVLAKNFQDFIFRQLLEGTREIYEYAMFEDDSEEQIKEHLHNQLRTHRPYLTNKQVKILEEIYARNIEEYEYKLPNGRTEEAEGLATFDEVDEILKQEIDFEYFDKEFNFTT